jgi:hypothetical protein
MDCGPWPDDNGWHHVAIQVSADRRDHRLEMFVDGVECGAHVVSPWTHEPLSLRVRGGEQDPHLLIDGLRVQSSTPYSSNFFPEKVPKIDGSTAGLWLMDEDDNSTVAHDATCRHPVTVDTMSFADDFPR